MPKNKKKNGSKKGAKPKSEDTTPQVPTYTIQVNEIITTLNLLRSPDNTTVLSSIISLDCYILKDEPTALVYLDSLHLREILIMLLTKPVPILRFVLKILIKMNKISKMPAEFEGPLIEGLTYHIIYSVDDTILEYSTHLLNTTCQNTMTCLSLANDDLVKALFRHMTSSEDIDIVNNSLLVIERLVSCAMARHFVALCEAFNIHVLNCMLFKGNGLYRETTLRIFTYMSNWEIKQIHEIFYDARTSCHLMTMMTSETWTDCENSALQIIYNSIRSGRSQIGCAESKNFLEFVNFAKTGPIAHGLACVSLISEYAKNEEVRQVLCDMGVPTTLIEFFKHDCDIIRVKLCEAIAEMCNNCNIVPYLAQHYLLAELGKVMGREDLPWIPYRQAPIKAIHIFLIVDTKLSFPFYRSDILRHIRAALIDRDQLDKAYFSMLVDIYDILSSNKYLHKYLFIRQTYERILDLLSEDNNDFQKKAVNILIKCIGMSECRSWFLELGGVNIMITLLSQSAYPLANELATFIQLAIKYKQMALSFLFSGSVPILDRLAQQDTTRGVIFQQISNSMLDYELSMKFHRLNFLTVRDITKNGFCVYIGSIPRDIPFEETDTPEKLTAGCTMLIANFQGRAHMRSALKEFEVMLKEGEATSESMSPHLPQNMIFKYKIPSLNPACALSDYYLSQYVQHLYAVLEHEMYLADKIRVIAQFVVGQLSDHQANYPMEHHYEAHIAEMKMKLLSNYLPLGHIRVGSMIERAVLFKVLSDRIGLPCTLHRTPNNWAWNEVPLYPKIEDYEDMFPTSHYLRYYVVDLHCHPGTLLPRGKPDAFNYCHGVEGQAWVDKMQTVGDASMPIERDDYEYQVSHFP